MFSQESNQEHIMETKPMTLENKIAYLNQLSDLYSKMKSDSNDFIRKDGVLQHIEWSMSHIAESIWQDSTSQF
jgi:hypothetical protein